MKVIREDTVNNPVARERFWREARVAARLNHPHICQIYEVGEADQQPAPSTPFMLAASCTAT